MKPLRYVILLLLAALLAYGCGGGKGKRPQGSLTAGHVLIGAADGARDVAGLLARGFEAQYDDAFVDIYRLPSRQLVDSLLSERTVQIFLDRKPLPAETAAFAQAKLKLYTYPVAYYPVYLLVPKSNPRTSMDSATFRDILTGKISNWKSLGGDNLPLTLYLPLPGEGAWQSLMAYYGTLDSVTAVACPTMTAMLDSAKDRPGALLVYAQPFDEAVYRNLDFERDGNRIDANVKTILDSPAYPFHLTLTYVTTHQTEDVAAGYLTYSTGNLGQRLLMEQLKYRPAAVPVRVVFKKS
jgi:hypothetical protein